MASLVVFADSRLTSALNRIEREAKKSQFFSNIFIYNENDLDPFFRSKYANLLDPGIRGYGYWVWKSQVITQALEKLPFGEILVYLDAGCHISKHGKTRFREYISILSQSPKDFLCFELSCSCGEFHPESKWTKADVFSYFGVLENERITKSPQICATVILVKNTNAAKSFLTKWQSAFDSIPPIYDDSQSKISNFTDFVENRHDQSIFSVMSKINDSIILSHEENYPCNLNKWGQPDWDSMTQFPFQARRNKKNYLQNLFELLVFRAKFKIKSMLRFFSIFS